MILKSAAAFALLSVAASAQTIPKMVAQISMCAKYQQSGVSHFDSIAATELSRTVDAEHPYYTTYNGNAAAATGPLYPTCSATVCGFGSWVGAGSLAGCWPARRRDARRLINRSALRMSKRPCMYT